MALKITSLKDVFKQNVINSVKVPTIWVDSLTKEEHVDFDHCYIESKDPKGDTWDGHPDAASYTAQSKKFDDLEVLFVNGPIKQVGSHVIGCGQIHYNGFYAYSSKCSLSQVFRKANNLEYLKGELLEWPKYSKEFDIPEDIFWGCPKLKETINVFQSAPITKVPSNLFAKCPELQSIYCAFYDSSITEIPEDLFKNNLQLKDLARAFSWTKVEKLPEHLFDPIIDNIIDEKVRLTGFVQATPLSDVFKGRAPYTPKEQAKRRDEYLTKTLPREFQHRLLKVLDNSPTPDYF